MYIVPPLLPVALALAAVLAGPLESDVAAASGPGLPLPGGAAASDSLGPTLQAVEHAAAPPAGQVTAPAPKPQTDQIVQRSHAEHEGTVEGERAGGHHFKSPPTPAEGDGGDALMHDAAGRGEGGSGRKDHDLRAGMQPGSAATGSAADKGKRKRTQGLTDGLSRHEQLDGKSRRRTGTASGTAAGTGSVAPRL